MKKSIPHLARNKIPDTCEMHGTDTDTQKVRKCSNKPFFIFSGSGGFVCKYHAKLLHKRYPHYRFKNAEDYLSEGYCNIKKLEFNLHNEYKEDCENVTKKSKGSNANRRK
jgi:hypothetical protein